MPYQTAQKRTSRKTRKAIDIVQKAFPKAYISTIDNSRRPQDSFSDMTNMELVQDNVARPRPPLVRYGTQPPYPVVGRGKYRYAGQRGLLWVFNVGGQGKLYYQLDGGAYTAISHTVIYDVTKWTMFSQSKGKVYPFNSSNNLTYLQLSDMSVYSYTSVSTPSITSVTGSTNLISGAKPYTYYYRITTSNEVGESIASTVSSVTTNSDRDKWSSETAIAKTVAIVWPAPAAGHTTTLYVGTQANKTNEIISLGEGATTYTDDGSLATNPYKLAPEGNSTQGFIPSWLYNDSKNSQIFGADLTNKMYYSEPGTANFSPYAGGGWVSIDEDGDTLLNYLDGFRDGQGNPVITASNRGAAGKGLLNHVTFETLNIGDQIITYPNVYPASGQSGTYAPRATIKSRDALTYFTGQDVKSTGTSQNIVNILTTNSRGQGIEPDLEKINLAALDGACGVEYKDRLYFCLPVSSNTNNEIWYLDESRKGAWILRWPVAARDIWLYEDNAGATHFCVLVGDIILEFTRAGAQTHQDDGVPFRSRLAFDALQWDEAGIALGNVRNQYFKFLQPKGAIQVNATGLTRKGVQQSAGSDTFTVTTTFTGYDIWSYDEHMYDDDPGSIESFGKSVAVLQLKPKGLLNQEAWEITGNTTGTDYVLSSVKTRGWYSEELIMKA